jgi:2-hydroxy-3-keto-5-methylthiopentenyl-1-phosphate phosphatase
MNEKELLDKFDELWDKDIHFIQNQINYLEIEQNHYGIDRSEIIKELYNEVYELMELQENLNK